MRASHLEQCFIVSGFGVEAVIGVGGVRNERLPPFRKVCILSLVVG